LWFLYLLSQSNCPKELRVNFKYDMNMKFADAFPNEVKTVTLYAFDKDGKLALQKKESVKDIENVADNIGLLPKMEANEVVPNINAAATYADFTLTMDGTNGKEVKNGAHLNTTFYVNESVAHTPNYFVLSIDTDKGKKIMVFANCGTSIVTPGNIQNLAFARSATTQYIPMWGVTTLTNELVVGKSNNLGTIDLLRSLAKVKVKLADGMKSRKYSLGAMQLNNYNTSGYTLPLTYNTVASTAAIRFGNSLHANSSWAQSITMTNNDDESIMLYIPEYDNINAATDRKATISLQLMRDGEEEGNYTLHFCNYTPEGAPDAASTYNIQRNHYYEYTVGLMVRVLSSMVAVCLLLIGMPFALMDEVLPSTL
jgi:hypothetical protein